MSENYGGWNYRVIEFVTPEGEAWRAIHEVQYDEMDALSAWLKSGRYLPEPLRDFHNQKDVFKAMHDIVQIGENDQTAKVDWITGQCYVIDVFLWFMARRGYTLQRTRTRLPFRDLGADVRAADDRRSTAFVAALSRVTARGGD